MKGWKKTGASSWEPDPETAIDYSDKIGHGIRFTNVRGEVFAGEIIDCHPAGLVKVRWYRGYVEEEDSWVRPEDGFEILDPESKNHDQ